MLVTTSLEGVPRGRPMAIALYEDGLLYFASRSEDEKLAEILNHPEVAVTLQKQGMYLSITGRARLETNTVLADRLWSPSMRLWFPEGPEDRHLTLIVVELLQSEYWDRRGLLHLQFLWEAGKAVVSAHKLDEDRLGGHAKVSPPEE